MNYLTISEEILLMAIWRLKENAYGVKIRKKVSQMTNQDITYGTLYSSLDQLVRKGLVTKTTGEPTPERGGRRKIYYSVSSRGLEALREAKKLHESLFHGISEFVTE